MLNVCFVLYAVDVDVYYVVARRSAKLLRESEQHMKDIMRVLEVSFTVLRHFI